MYDKMNRFLPPAGDDSFRAEFECWHPDAAFAFIEKPGFKSWTGAEIDYVYAENGITQADIPRQLADMVAHCWKDGAAPTAAARGPVSIGGARGNVFSGLAAAAQSKLTEAGKHHKMVSPTTSLGANMSQFTHLNGVAKDWTEHVTLKRVCAYTFRGDSRTPTAIRTSGGFSPPSTRTDKWYFDNVLYPQFSSYMKRRFNKDIDKKTFDDAFNSASGNDDTNKRTILDYSIWRALADREATHMGRMLAEEAMKGYISTSRATTVAKAFAKDGGWVYVTLVRGGFHVPPKGKTEWTKIFGEQELAFPGMVQWRDIFGFRQVSPDGGKKFVGPVYLRKGFDTRNCTAFRQVHDLLSGKQQ